MQRLVPGAEAADHHPDVLINYKRVTLTYSTHSEGGLTEKDFAGREDGRVGRDRLSAPIDGTGNSWGPMMAETRGLAAERT